MRPRAAIAVHTQSAHRLLWSRQASSAGLAAKPRVSTCCARYGDHTCLAPRLCTTATRGSHGCRSTCQLLATGNQALLIADNHEQGLLRSHPARTCNMRLRARASAVPLLRDEQAALSRDDRALPTALANIDTNAERLRDAGMGSHMRPANRWTHCLRACLVCLTLGHRPCSASCSEMSRLPATTG